MRDTLFNMFAVIIFALLQSAPTESVNGSQDPALDLNKSKELYQLVTNGQYDDAVSLVKDTDTALACELVCETVEDLLNSDSTATDNVMSFAYKLWSSGANDIVQRYFPAIFKNILNQKQVKIVNKEYKQALQLEADTDYRGDRLAWAGSQDQTNNQVSWKFIPFWETNEVVFKIYNIKYSMYLKLAVAEDSEGDRQAYCSVDSDTERHQFYLEPHYENGDLFFYIINFKYNKGLKLIVAADKMGYRRLMSHRGDIHENEDRFKWIISA